MEMYAQEGILPFGREAGTKRNQVAKMFDEIAHSYDCLNHSMSLGIDHVWRRDAIQYLCKHTSLHQPELLDVATGTGDLSIMAAKALPDAHITGIDISDEMMHIGRTKIEKEQLTKRISLVHEDCERMSFNDSQFDAIISSFGLRNFQNLDACLSEIRRVLKSSGMIVVIDLCTPTAFPMKQLFWIYKRIIMPIFGRIVSGDKYAYTYLPETMAAIPQADAMAAIFTKAGFKNVRFHRQLFGMSMLYAAEK